MALTARIWSFLVGYVAIPFAYYAVDSACHVPPLMVGFPVLLTAVLVATLLGALRLVQACEVRLRVRSPRFVGLGAGVGLLHWFPLYLVFGARFVWHSAGEGRLGLGLFLLNAVVPVVSLSGATYDGSVFALILAPFLLARFVGRWARRRAPG